MKQACVPGRHKEVDNMQEIKRTSVGVNIKSMHGLLKARILKWFAILFSSGPRFVRTLHHDLSVLGGPTWHGS